MKTASHITNACIAANTRGDTEQITKKFQTEGSDDITAKSPMAAATDAFLIIGGQ